MHAYDLFIHSPEPASFIVTAHDDEAAGSLTRESLQIDYAGESDPLVLASHVSLVARVSGHSVLKALLADLLKEVAWHQKSI